MIKRFIAFYLPHRALFFWDMVAVFLIAMANLVYPLIVKNIINEYVPQGAVDKFFFWSFVLLVIYVAKALLNYFIEYYGHSVGVRMQADVRSALFYHLQRLPFTYYDEHKSGDLMSRMVNDLGDFAELAHHGPENLLLSSTMLIGSFIVLSNINLVLTLAVFATLPLVILFALGAQKRMDDVLTRTREELSEVHSGLENALSGIRVTRAFTNSTYENAKFDSQIGGFVNATMLSHHVMGQLSSGIMLFTDMLYLVVIVLGGWFFFHGILNAGEFTVFLLYINTFLTPINQFWSLFERLQGGMSAFRRVLEIIDEEPESESPVAVRLDSVRGDISFDDVSFYYVDHTVGDDGEVETTSTEVISRLNLDIAAGETIAIVGPSGSGKTTLCHLIPRFYDVSNGCIRLDGSDITMYTRDSLRSQVGIVAQDVFLFAGSIGENIAYGDLNASQEQIVVAAKRANIHEHIMTLEHGYATDIGERGVKLSGGQKQRIAIARIFLKNPSILILDEATSALDNATEQLIQAALEELAVGRTTIIVAHRLSTIKNADRIILLTNKGISEQGSHTELMQRDGQYAELYRTQFRHDNEAE